MEKNKKVLKIVQKVFKIKEFKQDEAGDGIIEAYVSIFDNIDLVNEVIEKGAFTKSLSARKPKGCWMHNWDEPIALTLDAKEDDKGLYIKGQLILTVQKAKEAFELIKAGVIDEFSIGYEVINDNVDEKGIRHITEAKLYEWSPVLVGANPETQLISAKKMEMEIEVKADPVAGDACVMEDGTAGILTDDGNGALVCALPPKEEASKADPVEGDACTLEDGTAGTMQADENGNLVCKLPPAKQLEEDKEELKDLKAGRVLSEKNKLAIEEVVHQLETLTKQIKNTLTPLKELLTSVDNSNADKGRKPIEQNAKLLRIRQVAKQNIKANEFVLRITK